MASLNCWMVSPNDLPVLDYDPVTKADGLCSLLTCVLLIIVSCSGRTHSIVSKNKGWRRRLFIDFRLRLPHLFYISLVSFLQLFC